MKPQVRVYDVTGATLQAVLDKATGVQWQHPLAGDGSSAGTAQFQLLAKDAKASAVQRDRIVKMWWQGAERCAFRIHSIAWVLTDAGWRMDVTALQIRCLLGDAVALPEYGLRVGSGETRRFGFMSKAGAWYVSSEWVAPHTTALAAGSTGPSGFPDGGAYWLSAPTQPPVGGKTWYRATFTTTTTYPTVRLFVATDDAADIYLDGELVLQIPGVVDPTAHSADVTLPIGDHVLAVEMRDEIQWTGEALRGELLCCLASITFTTSTTDADAVQVSQVILRSNTSAQWTVRSDNTSEPGWRKAQIVKQLITEAQARTVRGPSALTLGFTDTLDSAGAAWTDRGDFEVQTLSDPVDRIAEALFDPTIDWDVDPTMTVQAWNRRGQDRTGGASPVILRLARDITGMTLTETYDVVTDLYGRTADGLVVHENSSAATTDAGGIVEAGLSLGSVSTTATATGLMLAHLDSLGYPTREVSGSMSAAGPQPYVDYSLGDTVRCPDGRGGFLAVRVLAITVDASNETVTAYPEVAVDRTVTL